MLRGEDKVRLDRSVSEDLNTAITCDVRIDSHTVQVIRTRVDRVVSLLRFLALNPKCVVPQASSPKIAWSISACPASYSTRDVR